MTAVDTAPAGVIAMVDALCHLGVTDVEMPASPMWACSPIQAAKSGGAK
jgi:hypothetical protein